MLVAEHAEAARDFLVDASDAITAGKRLNAAEMLWGAVAHAIIAVAQDRGWPFHYHRDLTSTAKNLAFEYQDWRMWGWDQSRRTVPHLLLSRADA